LCLTRDILQNWAAVSLKLIGGVTEAMNIYGATEALTLEAAKPIESTALLRKRSIESRPL
jgi:hypothetical protein